MIKAVAVSNEIERLLKDCTWSWLHVVTLLRFDAFRNIVQCTSNHKYIHAYTCIVYLYSESNGESLKHLENKNTKALSKQVLKQNAK